MVLFQTYTKQIFRHVSFSFYKDMMDIVFGPCGRGLVRVFDLSGSFSPHKGKCVLLKANLYVGENAALYETFI